MMDVAKARRLWIDLHDFAQRVKVRHDQLSFMDNWLNEAHSIVDCASCWWKVVRFCNLWPIEYGDGLYLWSICLHDYVNKELGRVLFYPDLTLEPLIKRGIIQ